MDYFSERRNRPMSMDAPVHVFGTRDLDHCAMMCLQTSKDCDAFVWVDDGMSKSQRADGEEGKYAPEGSSNCHLYPHGAELGGTAGPYRGKDSENWLNYTERTHNAEGEDRVYNPDETSRYFYRRSSGKRLAQSLASTSTSGQTTLNKPESK